MRTRVDVQQADGVGQYAAGTGFTGGGSAIDGDPDEISA